MPQSYTRQYHQLRNHIDQMLDRGAVIARRTPLTIRRGDRLYRVSCGMLISELPTG
ncbi:hypothetical protein [Pseudomonas sp.]|uniref:hypothetical protein n=1 Tax=Pseudomonas sp. TaxID=306 RepID=UPI0028B25922|nr:hypothetical protein [Pseudomonas sp.]